MVLRLLVIANYPLKLFVPANPVSFGIGVLLLASQRVHIAAVLARRTIRNDSASISTRACVRVDRVHLQH